MECRTNYLKLIALPIAQIPRTAVAHHTVKKLENKQLQEGDHIVRTKAKQETWYETLL